jgi:hypothetical protein
MSAFTPPVDCPTRLYALKDALAVAVIGLRAGVETVVKALTDEDATALAAVCRREAHPQLGDSHNFEMPEWDHVAHLIDSELRMRHFFRRAAEHEAATGRTDYSPRTWSAANIVCSCGSSVASRTTPSTISGAGAPV